MRVCEGEAIGGIFRAFINFGVGEMTMTKILTMMNTGCAWNGERKLKI